MPQGRAHQYHRQVRHARDISASERLELARAYAACKTVAEKERLAVEAGLRVEQVYNLYSRLCAPRSPAL